MEINYPMSFIKGRCHLIDELLSAIEQGDDYKIQLCKENISKHTKDFFISIDKPVPEEYNNYNFKEIL